MTRLVACSIALALVGACQSDPDDGASVGSACASVGSQSTCDETEICSAISSNNMCSLSCSSDSDCGENSVTSLLDGGTDGGTVELDGGAIINHCIDYQDAGFLCLRGCSQSIAGSCKRDDFVCITQNQGGDYYCVPDCRKQPTGFCTYPAQCSQNDGNCEDELCTTSATCPSGQICASVDGQSICVVSCEVAGCPSGSTCVNGGCNTVTLDAYALCGSSVLGSCSSGLVCAEGSSTDVCMVECSGDGGCATDTNLSGVCEGSICVPFCSSSVPCPANTTCVVADGGAEFCVPQ